MAAVVRALSSNLFSTSWSGSQKVAGRMLATSPRTQNFTANLILKVSALKEMIPTHLLAMPRSLLPGVSLNHHLCRRGSAPAGPLLMPNGSALGPQLTSASDHAPTLQLTLPVSPLVMFSSDCSAVRSLTDPVASLPSSCPTTSMSNFCRRNMCCPQGSGGRSTPEPPSLCMGSELEISMSSSMEVTGACAVGRTLSFVPPSRRLKGWFTFFMSVLCVLLPITHSNGGHLGGTPSHVPMKMLPQAPDLQEPSVCLCTSSVLYTTPAISMADILQFIPLRVQSMALVNTFLLLTPLGMNPAHTALAMSPGGGLSPVEGAVGGVELGGPVLWGVDFVSMPAVTSGLTLMARLLAGSPPAAKEFSTPLGATFGGLSMEVLLSDCLGCCYYSSLRCFQLIGAGHCVDYYGPNCIGGMLELMAVEGDCYFLRNLYK